MCETTRNKLLCTASHLWTRKSPEAIWKRHGSAMEALGTIPDVSRDVWRRRSYASSNLVLTEVEEEYQTSGE